MRSYSCNSPQAAARIVALACLADGHLCKTELDLLDQLGAHRQLGLNRAEFDAVLHTFCADLLMVTHTSWADVCCVDFRTLEELLAEIDDPLLRLKILRLCVAIVEVDQHVVDAESIMLKAAVAQWGLQGAMMRSGPSQSGEQRY